jgi:hypothetical protein
MTEHGQTTKKLGSSWDRGDAMVKKGLKLRKESEALASKSKDKRSESERLVNEGNQLKQESEIAYRGQLGDAKQQ